MIDLLEYTAHTPSEGKIETLHDAVNVKITSEINGEYGLEFDYPLNTPKSQSITINRICVIGGQMYRITKLSRDSSGTEILHVTCTHVFHCDSRNIHIQTIGGTAETIGANPSAIMELAFADGKFHVLTDAEAQERGLQRIGADGFLIDFEAVDKTTPYDVVKQIITNCGKGELYIDNYNVAIVETIGSDSSMRIDTARNAQNISIERDISEMITRLYPYGKDDAHIGSVNNDVQYIDSPNAAIYGVKAGYKDYSDYEEPADILSHALWEFNSKNADRIDVPDVNITATFIDLAKLGGHSAIRLGDAVTVVDNGNAIRERVIKMEYYPYEPQATTVSIGRIKKDLFFYLNQMGKGVREYIKNSTSNGKVSAKAIAGKIELASDVSGVSSTGDLRLTGDVLSIQNGGYMKCRIGNVSGTFVFDIYNNAATPEKAIYIDGGGLKICASSVKVGGCTVTAENGSLYIDGKKITVEEASE